jgi:N12 class adenine-specific DNA methylase
MRPHQRFAAKFILAQRRVLIADEIGLAKTIEAMAAACRLFAKGGRHTLIISPLSVVHNWYRELQKSVLRSYVLSNRDYVALLLKSIRQGGVAIVSYWQFKETRVFCHFTIY